MLVSVMFSDLSASMDVMHGDDERLSHAAASSSEKAEF